MASIKLYLFNLFFLLGFLKDATARPVEDDSPSRMNLSSYEMYTTAELLCEIVVRPCKQVDRPLIAAIKNFIFNGLGNAPKKSNSTIHSRFMESYVNLVNCLSFADWTFEKKAKNLDTTFQHTEEHSSGKGAKSHSHPVHRFRRSVESDLIEAANSEENSVNSRKTSMEQEVDMSDYDRSFDLFFYYVFSIVQKVCPTTRATFSLDFILPSIEQTVEWIMKDGTVHKKALLKYFHDGKLLEDLKKCDSTVNVEEYVSEMNEDGEYDPHAEYDESILVGGGNEDTW